jgi:hypothetical protein
MGIVDYHHGGLSRNQALALRFILRGQRDVIESYRLKGLDGKDRLDLTSRVREMIS